MQNPFSFDSIRQLRTLCALALLFGCQDNKPLNNATDLGDTGGDSGILWDARFDSVAAAIDIEREELGAPGIAVAIIEGGQITFSAGFGSRDADDDAGPRPNGNTLFRIGSVNKVLTATNVMQQVEKGSLALETPITDWVPELVFQDASSATEVIEIGHLLQHTGALYDYTPLNCGSDDDRLLEIATSTLVDNYYLMAPAGRFWNYSNPNFALAGLMAETATETPYRELMEAELFEPLQMNRTVFLGEEGLELGNYATGLSYDWTGQTADSVIAAPDSYDCAFSRPAGFAWSSVNDLARFGIFLMQGDASVLDDALRTEITTGQISTLTMNDHEQYGGGLIIYDGFYWGNNWVDTPMWNHGGAIPGYSASIFLIPDLEFGMVVLANTDNAYLEDSVATAIDTLVTLPDLVDAPDLSVNTDAFDQFEGYYYDEHNVGAINITNEAGVLTATMPLLDYYGIPYEPELTPYTPNNFIQEIQGANMLVTFIPDDEDESAGAEYFRTRYFVATRDDESDSNSKSNANEPSSPTIHPKPNFERPLSETIAPQLHLALR